MEMTKRLTTGAATLAMALAMVALSERPAHAGRIFLFAEGATTDPSGVAVKTYHTNNVGDNYATIDCGDVSSCNSTWPMAIPPDAAASTVFQYRVHFETNEADGSSDVCGWDISAYAYPAGAPIGSLIGATASTSSSTSAALSSGLRYITNASASTAAYNLMSGTSCTSSACLNTNAVLFVKINTTSTALSGGAGKNCMARMIEVIY